MKFKKCLLVCLILQTLLIFCEAGGNMKRNPSSPSRLRPGSRTTSPVRFNSGRVSPSGTNGRSQARGTSMTNTDLVRSGSPPQASGSPRFQTPQGPVWSRLYAPQAPGSPRIQTPQAPGAPRFQTPQAPGSPRFQTPQAPGSPRFQNPQASAWVRSQTPQAPGSPRFQNPQASAWVRSQTPQAPGSPQFQNPQASAWVRSQTPQAPGSPRFQNPQASAWVRSQTPQAPGSPQFQNPQASAWVRSQTPQASGWSSPQTPVYSPFGVGSVSRPQSPGSDFFPGLAAPKRTFAEAEEQRRLEILKSPSSSSISSTGSGYHSGSGRSSVSSMGSFSSGYSSSGNLFQPIGLDAPKSSAIQKSIASPRTCVDTKTMPMVIARAENCFDYFRLAVFWAPGYAYKQKKSGNHIRVNKVRPSWIIHGLWPSMFDKRKNPISTCPRSDIYYRRDRFITNKILGVLENTWYTILAKGYSDNTKFWEHEFKDHGSCASRSSVIGNDVKYFEKTLELFNQLNIGTTLYNAQYKVGTTTKLRNIVFVIEDRIGATINADIITNSNTGENYLSELYFCYDINLRVMDCPYVNLPQELLDKQVKIPESLPIA
uniref:Ribonuclease T2 domain n=1 Tax=Glyptapanteles indiensis TaxID=92994 RepID=A0JCS7_GLYIN|nr:Ribonuclease T2 domain [Glyptapanteles indiensis]